MFIISFPITYMKNLEYEKLWATRIVTSTLPLFMIYYYTFGIADSFCACFRLYKVSGPSCQPQTKFEYGDSENNDDYNVIQENTYNSTLSPSEKLAEPIL